MKNLAQKTTGEILVINKIRSDKKIVWTIFSNGVLFQAGISYKDGLSEINKTVLPTIYMNYPDYLDWIMEEAVITENPDYERVTKNNVNWVYNKGVTNINTTVRVYIPHKIIGINAQTGNAMDLYLQSINSQKAFRTKDKQGIVQYLEILSVENEAMLLTYEGVIIDLKV